MPSVGQAVASGSRHVPGHHLTPATGGFAPRIGDLRRGKATVAARRDDRRQQPALPDGAVQGLLADTQEARRRARADQLVILTAPWRPTA
jgi:hypothetical protein